MKILDNINSLFGDAIKGKLDTGAKLKVAASCFSIYAYEALKKELELQQKNGQVEKSCCNFVS